MTVGVSVVLSRQTIPSNWATVSSATGRTSADGKKINFSLALRLMHLICISIDSSASQLSPGGRLVTICFVVWPLEGENEHHL